MEADLNPKKLSEWVQFTKIIAEKIIAEKRYQSEKDARPQEKTLSQVKVLLENDTLKYGNLAIPLYSRPMTAQLIRPFFKRSDHFLSKETILKEVYKQSSSISPRMHQSHNQNLLKLISRSRRFLEEACKSTAIDQKIEWFPFDKQSKRYRLYQVTYPGRFH